MGYSIQVHTARGAIICFIFFCGIVAGFMLLEKYSGEHSNTQNSPPHPDLSIEAESEYAIREIGVSQNARHLETAFQSALKDGADEWFIEAYEKDARSYLAHTEAMKKNYERRLKSLVTYQTPSLYLSRASLEFESAMSKTGDAAQAVDAALPWAKKALQFGGQEEWIKLLKDTRFDLKPEAMERIRNAYAAAENHSPDEVWNMAKILEFAPYSPENELEYQKLLKQAAAGGVADAMFAYGMLLMNGDDGKKGQQWREGLTLVWEASEQNSSAANYLYGLLLDHAPETKLNDEQLDAKHLAILTDTVNERGGWNAVFNDVIRHTDLISEDGGAMMERGWAAHRKLLQIAFLDQASDYNSKNKYDPTPEKCRNFMQQCQHFKRLAPDIDLENSRIFGFHLTSCYMALLDAGQDYAENDVMMSAAYDLALMYFNLNSSFVGLNVEKALTYMIYAAENDDAVAQKFLSEFFQKNDFGYNTDEAKSNHWRARLEKNPACVAGCLEAIN